MSAAPTERADRQLLERLIALSDGIFAVALTLLILTLAVPRISQGQVATELPSQLLALVPSVVAYVFSFFVVMLFWVAHYRIFYYITHADRTLITLNSVFLLSITFIPFPTSLVSEYGSYQLTWIIYAGSMALGGSLLTLLWLYASHNHRLVDPDLDPQTIRNLTVWRATIPIVFVLSIAVSFISVFVAQAIAVSLFILLRALEHFRPFAPV